MTDVERVKELVVGSANELRLAYQCWSNGRPDLANEHADHAVALAKEARALAASTDSEATPTGDA